MRPASHDELETVRAAVAEFKAHWEAIRPPFPCPFEGTTEDIHALDYLDYEGIGYPASGIGGAALVWGNVLARQGPFRWHLDGFGHLMLSPPGETSLAIWPYGRVVEIQNGLSPQFDKYRWLTEEAVVECLGRAMMDRDDETLMGDLVSGLAEDGYARSTEEALRAVRGLRRE